jgi:hypothetical protein
VTGSTAAVSTTHVRNSSPRTEPSAKARPKNAIQAMTLRSQRLRCVVPLAVLMAHPCSQPLQLKPSMRATLPASRRHLSSYEMCFASGRVQREKRSDLLNMAVRTAHLSPLCGWHSIVIEGKKTHASSGRYRSICGIAMAYTSPKPKHKKTGPANGPGLGDASACDRYGVTVNATRNATFGRTGSSLATQT